MYSQLSVHEILLSIMTNVFTLVSYWPHCPLNCFRFLVTTDWLDFTCSTVKSVPTSGSSISVCLPGDLDVCIYRGHAENYDFILQGFHLTLASHSTSVLSLCTKTHTHLHSLHTSCTLSGTPPITEALLQAGLMASLLRIWSHNDMDLGSFQRLIFLFFES